MAETLAAKPRTYPRCGVGLPEGASECPRCLLSLGLKSDAGPEGPHQPERPPPPAAGEPPSLEEACAAFPDLEVLELLGRGGMGADPTFAERFLRAARDGARSPGPPRRRSVGSSFRMVLRSFAATLLLAAQPAMATLVPLAGIQDPDPQLIAAFGGLRIVRSECDWRAVIELARQVRRRAPRGSELWFEACASEALALYEVWEPEELGSVATVALEAAADLRRVDMFTVRSAMGPLDPTTAGHVADIQELFARLLQSRGQHAQALGFLRLLMDDLHSGPILGDGTERMARVGYDAAASLIVLGRGADSLSALGSLRDNFPGTRESAVANALLQSWRQDLGLYRGDHQGDAEHMQRMRAALALVPAARKRLAARLGWPEDQILPFAVGFSDAVPGILAAAVTEGDPRRINHAPVVVVFCETLALGLQDVEQVLVHELSHAALMIACGPPYARFPFWLIEGVSEALAEQLELNVQLRVSNQLASDAAGFLAQGLFERELSSFDTPACSPGPGPGVGLSLLLLMERHGLEGLRSLIAALVQRHSPDAALREVTGLGETEYVAAALAHARDVLERRRRELAEAVRPLVEAEARGPEIVIGEAGRLLSSSPADVALGFALWKRATTLESLKRYEAALEAFTGIAGSRPANACYTELELMGRARCLIGLERKEEARALLAIIQRDALTPDVVRWAQFQAEKLGALDDR